VPDGVLVTRPEPGATETAQRLRALGFHPILAPLLTVRPRTVLLPARVDAIVVASGNAIPSLSAILRQTALLAVGDATAARAKAAGFTNVISAGGDAADLAELAGQACAPGATLLMAAARQQGAVLAAALRLRGFAVHRRIAYVAEPVRRMPDAACQALEARTLIAALFLSAETAQAFVRLLPSAGSAALCTVDALAIGDPAAAALRVLPWRRVRVSAMPTLDSILAML